MIKRKKIALTYFYSENWIAGSYYVVNLIKALNHLEEAEKPHLFVLNHDDQRLDLIKEIGYPYLSFIHPNAHSSKGIGGIMERIVKRIKGQDYFLKRKLRGVDHVFEGGDQYPFIKNQYYWVHDFQEFRLPEFFSKADAEKRSSLPRKVAGMRDAVLIVSSYDALNDFNTFIPGAVCKVNVWRFTSSPPDFSAINFKEECGRLKIDRPFFICSNQFWQHKNHKAILEAIRLLKEKNLQFQVVFTGQNFDHRNPEYFKSLQSFITANQLEPWVNFVGFIDRKVQLCVAKHAISYIQPSFFEGWSTTVEDAKYLNQYVLLSDIPVHREQMNYNVSFFNPSNPAELAQKMETLVKGEFKKEERDYKQSIINYGKDVLKTFSVAG